jgi:hypothetical protein
MVIGGEVYFSSPEEALKARYAAVDDTSTGDSHTTMSPSSRERKNPAPKQMKTKPSTAWLRKIQVSFEALESRNESITPPTFDPCLSTFLFPFAHFQVFLARRRQATSLVIFVIVFLWLQRR